MTQAILSRSDRACGICERHEVIPIDDRPGYFTVRDTATGSGRPHIATAISCDCADFLYRSRDCKHMQAVHAEEAALEAYAAAWDATPQAQEPKCPMCGAALESRQYYIGGRGYVHFEVCSGDGAHYCRQA